MMFCPRSLTNLFRVGVMRPGRARPAPGSLGVLSPCTGTWADSGAWVDSGAWIDACTWILCTGTWADSGTWADTCTWST